MKREYLTSTSIHWIAYDNIKRVLEVGFHNTGVYQYFDVPPRTYKEFLAASSKGEYFNMEIKDDFQFVKKK